MGASAGAERFDAVIIGAGQAGGPLSTALAAAGKRTALVERKHYGGTCINDGCTPTKTMIASGRAAYLARRGPDYGVHTGDVTVDQAVVRRRKRDIVASWSAGSEQSVRSGGVEAVDGQARLTGPHALTVTLDGGEERRLEADWVFLNVGERPAVPPIDGLADVPYLTSTTVMELGDTPRHLVIIGAGYIALEFGQLFRRLGADVTMLVRGDELLGREDRDVADALRDILAEDGIDLRFGTQATHVSTTADGGVSLELKGSDGPAGTLEASHLLVATGRTPNTGDLGLDAAGVETDGRGYVKVNGRLETSAAGVWALGDCKGGPAFTHISYDDFRIVRDNLLHGGDRTTDGRIVPYTVFTDPQLGRVGLSERQARDAGHDVRVATLPMSSVARAIETDETRGLMKAVVDAKTERILGAAVLGIDGGEVATVIQVAMMGGLPYTALREACISHPTVSESLNNLFTSLG